MYQLMAKSYELVNGKCYVDGVLQSSTDECTEFVKTAFTIGAAILIPILLIALVFFIFWVVMLVHAVSNNNLKDRTLWIVILLAGLVFGFYWIAAIVYYFAAKRPYDKGKTVASNQDPKTTNKR